MRRVGQRYLPAGGHPGAGVLQVEVEVQRTGVSELSRVKDLEARNDKLKRMYAELAIDNAAITDPIEKEL